MNEYCLGYTAENKQEAINIFLTAMRESNEGKFIYIFPREKYYATIEYHILLLPKKYPAYAYRWITHYSVSERSLCMWCIEWKYDDKMMAAIESDKNIDMLLARNRN